MWRFLLNSSCPAGKARGRRRLAACRLCVSITVSMICHRRSKRKFQSSEARAMTIGQSQPLLAKLFALGVEDFEFAKQRGLRFDLRAVAHDNNLHVCRVEILARRFDQIDRSERAYFCAIRFEIVVRQVVQGNNSDLAEQTVLRSKSHR